MSLLTKILLPLALMVPASTDGGFLGVILANQDGPTVTQVLPDTAAAKSDIKVGDKFVKVDGKETPDVAKFMEIVGAHSVGDRVRFDIDRSGHELTLYVVLGKRPADLEQQMGQTGEEEPAKSVPLAPSTRRGGAVAAAPAPSAGGGQAFLGVTLEEDLEISSVVPNGPAMQAGIREGDRITRLGRAGDLETADDLRAALKELKPGQTVSVRVRRGDATETVSVTLGTKPAENAAENADEDEDEAVEAKAAETAKAEKTHKAENKAHAEKAAAEKNKVEKQARAEKVAAEKAHAEGEGEAKGGMVRARSQGAGESENRDAEVSKLRDELRELRDEIRELKALVKKLNK